MIDNSERLVKMQALLEEALTPDSLQIDDDSHLHAGHAGAASGAGHFTVYIVSDVFAGKPPLARHRLVYNALDSMMPDDIHALAIRAKTLSEAN